MSTNRFKKLWKPNQRSTTDLSSDAQRQSHEGDVNTKISNTLSGESPTKAPERKTSRTRRDVKTRSVNLGKLIGLWKRIESLDKENHPLEKEKSTLRKQKSVVEEDPAIIKSEEVEKQRNLPLSEDIAVRQYKGRNESGDTTKNITSIANVTSRKIANDRIGENITGSKSLQLDKSVTEKREIVRRGSGNTILEPKKTLVDINENNNRQASVPSDSLESETGNWSSLSNEEILLRRSSREGSFRRNDSKRLSLRRGKLASVDKNLAADFNDIYKRLSIHSTDFPNILDTEILESGAFVSQRENGISNTASEKTALIEQFFEKETGVKGLETKYNPLGEKKPGVVEGNIKDNIANRGKGTTKSKKSVLEKSLSFNDCLPAHQKLVAVSKGSVCRAESLNSEQGLDRKKKKLLRKASTSSIDSTTGIVKGKDVKNILQRLSVNYPNPPIIKVNAEEMERMDIREDERRRGEFDRRRSSLGKQNKNESVRKWDDLNVNKGPTPYGGGKVNDVQELDELDQMIANANKTSINNLTTLSEKKYKAMQNQSSSYSGSLSQERPSSLSNSSYQVTVEKTSKSPPRRRTISSPRVSPIHEKSTPFLNEKVRKKTSKSSSKSDKSAAAKHCQSVETMNAESDKDSLSVKRGAVSSDKIVKSTRAEESGRNPSRSRSDAPSILIDFERKRSSSLPRKTVRPLSRDHSLKTFQKHSEWLDKMVSEAVKNKQHMPPIERQKSSDFLSVGLPILPTAQKADPTVQITKSNYELDSARRSEYIESEPIELPKRRAWLENLIRRNSGRSKRLSKSKSMCDLNSLTRTDSFNAELAEVSVSSEYNEDDNHLDVNRSVPKQESVEEITASIDVESRGNAYMLPSVLRKRRSLYIENSNMIGEENDILSPTLLGLPPHDQTMDNASNKPINQSESFLENLENDSENIKLPNIRETAMIFQQKESLGDAEQTELLTRLRPKSYCGDFLSQFIFSNENSNESDKKASEVIKGDSSNTPSSLGKVLISKNATKPAADVNNNDNDNLKKTNGQIAADTAMQITRNDSERRDSFRNYRILREIAENQKREKEVRDSRMLQFFNIADINVDLDDVEGIGIEGNTDDKGKHPKGLQHFLHENEMKR